MKYQITITYRTRTTPGSDWVPDQQTHMTKTLGDGSDWGDVAWEAIRKARQSAGHFVQLEIQSYTFTPLDTVKA